MNIIFFYIYYAQLFAQLVSCDWQEVTFQTKAEWRSAWTICGVLCVMTPGITLMLPWCVDNLVTLQMVRRLIDLQICSFILEILYTNRCCTIWSSSFWCWCWSNPSGQCGLYWQGTQPHQLPTRLLCQLYKWPLRGCWSEMSRLGNVIHTKIHHNSTHNAESIHKCSQSDNLTY